MASTELQNIVALLRERQTDEPPPLEELRENFDNVALLFPPAPDASCEPVEAGGVPAEWVVTKGCSDDHVVLYLHGGGYVIGSLDSHRNLATHLSRACGARVLSVDYRLAPEHPFPAALEDAQTGYAWLLSQGFDPGRIAIAGDSAGGGLTVTTLVALRDAREDLPRCAALLSPWVDLELTGSSHEANAEADPLLDRVFLERSVDWCLAGKDPANPLASPIHANLAGLPPMLVQVGGTEILLDDAKSFARRAEDAGVDVECEVWDEAFHIWHVWAGLVPEATEAVEKIGAFIRSRWDR